VESGLWSLAIILALATVVSYYYYHRVAWFMWMRPAPEEGSVPAVWAGFPLRAGLLASALLLLILGIFPGGLLALASAAAEGLFASGSLLASLVP